MSDTYFMALALRLARRGYGAASPNPMVGAVLVKNGEIIGHGWHRQVGGPHAEIEAIRDAQKRHHTLRGATMFVTLEPCSTHGRMPPCTEAIISAGITRVIVGAVDPNPEHRGKGLKLLQRAGIAVESELLADEATHLNEAFNHWIVHRTPFVIVKAAMSLDGKIATVRGESKWITGERARAYGMKLRQGADAILVGVNTVAKDDPSLTFRGAKAKTLRRIILDPTARTPLSAKVVSDEFASLTTIVVTKSAPKQKVARLAKQARVMVAPMARGKINLRWLLKKLGAENVASLLVEGGGETNAEFLLQHLAQRIAFFYAPIIIGGRNAPKGVAGDGIARLAEKLSLRDVEWQRLGPDLLLTGRF